MIELLVGIALADIIFLDVDNPPPPCDCPAGRPEYVEHRPKKLQSVLHERRMRMLGYTEQCRRGHFTDYVWCGPKGTLPVCGEDPCGTAAGLGTEVARWDENGQDPQIEGAVATCRHADGYNIVAQVWCVPTPPPLPPTPESLELRDLERSLDLPASPASPHPGGCATGGLPASALGLGLVGLAARSRRRTPTEAP